MSKEKAAASVMWFNELVQFSVYKRTQGRIARQATFAALAVGFVVGAYWIYSQWGADMPRWMAYSIPSVLVGLGLWVSFRVVNMPRFADFLIAVEAEMNKVSWPSRAELIRSSIVVIFVIFFLSLVLFGFDLVWGALFRLLGIVKQAS